MEEANEPIIITESFTCSQEVLWDAITQYSELKQWFFEEMSAFEAQPGYLSEFVIHNEERVFSHQIKVLEIKPCELMIQQWQFKEYPGTGHVIYRLSTEGVGSSLELTSKVVDPFPNDIPEFERESGVGGWSYFIKERLKNYLKG